VAEDEPLVRSHVESQLRALGYDVVSVEDGLSALSLVEHDRSFDLLLSDIVMPGGMSGPELAERAQELQPGLKVLFMSGYAETALIDNSKIEVGTRLLNKPFRRLELATKLREVLGDHSAQAQDRSRSLPS
jgi:CheY-like chemotaxis protein